MAMTVKNKLDESMKEVRKSEYSRDVSDVSSSKSSNNVTAHNSINEITEHLICRNDNDNSNIDDNSAIERNEVSENSLAIKLNTEIVYGVKKDIECKEERNENSDIPSRVFIDQSKNNNYQAKAESIVGETVLGKRKRRLSSDVKREKTPPNDDDESTKPKKPKNINDSYCWRCHKDIVEANCSACLRSWHRKCMGGTPPTSTNDNWICGECASILQAENATTRSPTMAHVTVDHLCMVLKYVIERMRNFPGAEPFWTAVDLEEVPNYLEYVVKPMDLALLESNVNSKLYGSTDAFMADAKWIQHNCIVFNTCGGVYADTSKLTNAAKQIIKIARQELSEIEACPDCYARGRNLPRPHPSWFIEACRQPHPLIWAKLKGFPYWPAKALPRVNGQGHVDVRFFGEHDRAWVSPKDIYLYSRDPPTSLPRKKKQDMVECMREITQHCQKLEKIFGPFEFAPGRIQYNPHDPMQIKLMFPEYNPDSPYDSTKTLHHDSRTSSPSRKQSSPIKNSSPSANDVFIKNNSSTKESESNNNKDHSHEIGDSLKQKSRLKKPAAIRHHGDQINTSDSSVMNDSTSRKIVTATSKNSTVRKTLSKKSSEASRDDTMDTESAHRMLQSVSPKSRQNHIRKVNATTTPSPASNATRKITKPNIIRTYKPKARIVDKLNAEKNEINKKESRVKSANSEETEDSEMTAGETSPRANLSSSGESVDDSPIKLSNLSIDSPNENLITSRIERESKDPINPPLSSPSGKRQSKARKSFPNKPPTPIRIPIKPAIDSSDTKVSAQTNLNQCGLNYQLPPPEAGPLSAQLNRGANALAAKMARLIEETIQEATQSKIHDLGDAVDAHEATVYSLRLQMERMRWQHQQQLAELKYNTDQTLREMRASLEVERLRAIEEIRKVAEEERIKSVAETKSKQWCSFCGREALYYCCWNTSYCNHACQRMHWQAHMRKCMQKQTNVNSTSQDAQEASCAHQSQKQVENQQPQAMPRLVISAQHGSSNVRGA